MEKELKTKVGLQGSVQTEAILSLWLRKGMLDVGLRHCKPGEVWND